MSNPKTPLFVRLPRQQAAALDRLADRTGRPKQHLLSELLADRLPSGPLSVGRIEVTNPRSETDDDVLTLEEAATLFKLSPEAFQAAAETGNVPGRRFGKDWRFSKLALLSWLARNEEAETRKGRR